MDPYLEDDVLLPMLTLKSTPHIDTTIQIHHQNQKDNWYHYLTPREKPSRKFTVGKKENYAHKPSANQRPG